MNDLLLLVASREGQQCYIAGLFNGSRQPTLVGSTNAGEAPRHNLAAFGHKLL
jgi:hypothetical protein